MLFDLRSRGRRRTVQVIYLLLALIMVSGLVLVGVGTGNGNGGLLNAFTNNGSGGGSTASDAQVKAALKATQKDPTSAGAWGSLVQARFELAGQGNNYDSSTSTYAKGGKAQLTEAVSAYEHYTTLTKTPAVSVARLAAEAYTIIAQYKGASSAWQAVAAAEPSANTWVCVAATSYAAKNTRLGALAAAQAVKLAPKLQRVQLKEELTSAKTEGATLAQEAC
jgi:hypothetical protein